MLIESAPIVSRRFRPVRAARALLALAWVVWAVLTWWSAPRQADIAKLDAELAAGRVTAYTVGSWELPPTWLTVMHPARHGDNSTILWATTDHRTYRTQLLYQSSSGSRPIDGDRASLVQRFSDAGVFGGDLGWIVGAQMLGMSLGLLGFLILLGGPPPARGTRVFWFWVGQIPLGLGLLAWLAWERPWVEQPDAPKRKTGWLGFGLLLLGGIVTTALMAPF